jgi:hypothetical protein
VYACVCRCVREKEVGFWLCKEIFENTYVMKRILADNIECLTENAVF